MSESKGSDETDTSDMINIHLRISVDQLHAVQLYFHEQGWDYDECEILDEGSSDEEEETDDHNPPPDVIIPKDENAEECPFCYCQPCITHEDVRQQWWQQQPAPPHHDNTGCRKKVYKRFWTMIYNRGVWHDPRYLDKKADALGLQRNRQHWVHRRDIIPLCVLKLVRYWYPNPEGEPYMGHHWE